MYCSRCRAPLAPGWLACPNCGLQFGQAAPPYRPPKQRIPVWSIVISVIAIGATLMRIAGSTQPPTKPTKTPSVDTSAAGKDTDSGATDTDSDGDNALKLAMTGKPFAGPDWIIKNIKDLGWTTTELSKIDRAKRDVSDRDVDVIVRNDPSPRQLRTIACVVYNNLTGAIWSENGKRPEYVRASRTCSVYLYDKKGNEIVKLDGYSGDPKVSYTDYSLDGVTVRIDPMSNAEATEQ